MQQALRRSSLVPTGFVVESAFCQADSTVITVRTLTSFGLCPSCGTVSRRVHSHYRHRVTDLPLSGRIVQLVVITRRFRCDAVLCGRQIFTERFPEGVLAPSARRTTRLDCIVHHLGLALGGRPAALLARRLMLPVSNDTLLRVVRRRSRPRSDPLKVVGIDDWAWRRNHRYASIICNLERRRIVTLLPDREPATAQAWFAAHPTIGIIARDRGGGYGEAAAKALPHAVQVADRWHLMENASDAVRPTTLKRGAASTNLELHKWLDDQKNRRALPYKLEKVGYSVVRNLEAEEGLWLVRGKREAVYARSDIKKQSERLSAVHGLQQDDQARAVSGARRAEQVESDQWDQ